MKSLIHVNQHHIAANAKDNGTRPVFTIKRGGKTLYARGLEILGPSRFVYNGSKLSCGARVWIETNSELKLYDEMTYQESIGA